MTRFDDATLEAAAALLEQMAGNSLYQAAWRAGAKRIRALKVLNDNGDVLKDSREKITTTCIAR